MESVEKRVTSTFDSSGTAPRAHCRSDVGNEDPINVGRWPSERDGLELQLPNAFGAKTEATAHFGLSGRIRSPTAARGRCDGLHSDNFLGLFRVAQ